MATYTWPIFSAHFWLFLMPAVRGENVNMYFGAGCFWHVQHEFVKAERSILQRKDSELTAFVGYAGNTAPGTACYYDGKVTSEVVGIQIPKEKVYDFAAVYFALFNGHDRSHANDKGPYYRAVIGLPGGTESPLMSEIQRAQESKTKTFDLTAGQGDDADTLGTKTIWVYDSATYPFHQGELYHQFHDDYLPGGNYEEAYNKLLVLHACAGNLKSTGCPKDGASVVNSLDCSKDAQDAPTTKINQGGSGELPTSSSKDSTATLPNHGGSGELTNMKASSQDSDGKLLPNTGGNGSSQIMGKSANAGMTLHAPSVLLAVCFAVGAWPRILTL